MKKTLVIALSLGLLVFAAVQADATLITIGTADYMGGTYNLIWDDDNNGNSVVWLDYTNAANNWAIQTAWAAGLGGALTINLLPAYSIAWNDPDWRLPATVDGIEVYGFDGTTTGGYNITSSEMGHLYYEELKNLGYVATDGTSPQPNWGLINTGDFDNLVASRYWSGTEYADYEPVYFAWFFDMVDGYQVSDFKGDDYYGLAVRSGQVSAIPEPATMLLLGTGLVGVAGAARRRKKKLA